MGAGEWITLGIFAISTLAAGAKLYADLQVLKSERADDRRIIDRLQDIILDELRKD